MSMTSTNSDSSEGVPVETPCGGSASASASARPLSRYESQKRRDWNTFGQYLRNHRPPLVLSRCSGAHVLEFLRYLDQFGKTKVHVSGCPFFGHPQPPAPCSCPLRQAWGSLDALIGRLRAAFEENGGHPEANPFGARAVRLYLREVRETQAKARGIAYEKKKRKRPPQKPLEKSSTTAVGGVSPTPEMVVPGFAPTTTEMVQCSPAVAPSCLAALPMLQLAEWNQVYGGGGYPYQLYQYQLLDHGNGYMAAAAAAAAGAAPPPMAEVGEIATHNTVTT